VVEKIWNFEISGLFLWIFLRLGTLLEFFFKNQRSNYVIMDCRLILEKPRGFFAKLPGIINFGIIFVRKKLWTRSTGCGPRPASVHGGPQTGPWRWLYNTHFLQEYNFCPHRSAYKNAYQIIVHMKNFQKINKSCIGCIARHGIFYFSKILEEPRRI
jgi:hypothetical protein